MAIGVIRRVDHIFVTVDDPIQFFTVLVDKLGFIVVLPVTNAAGFTSGAFNLGNVYLEILQAAPWSPEQPPDGLRVNGIAFEPEPPHEATGELDRREIGHSPVNTFVMPELPDGVTMPDLEIPVPEQMRTVPQPGAEMMRSFTLEGFIGGNAMVFCCEYLPGNLWAPIRTARDAMREKLDGVEGGPLGITSLSEIVIGAKDVEAESARWQALLDPIKANGQGLWSLGDGPALRLVQSDRDAVLTLKLRTRSLERAETFLRQQEILDSSSGNEATIRPHELNGLNIMVVG